MKRSRIFVVAKVYLIVVGMFGNDLVPYRLLLIKMNRAQRSVGLERDVVVWHQGRLAHDGANNRSVKKIINFVQWSSFLHTCFSALFLIFSTRHAHGNNAGR